MNAIARRVVMALFDDLLNAIRRYIRENGSERLVGVVPELETLRHQFESATADVQEGTG